MDPLAEKVEMYLADRNREFSITELCRRLHLRRHRLANVLHELECEGLVEIHYHDSEIFVKHKGWVKK